jgi:hypothetical protein
MGRNALSAKIKLSAVNRIARSYPLTVVCPYPATPVVAARPKYVGVQAVLFNALATMPQSGQQRCPAAPNTRAPFLHARP